MLFGAIDILPRITGEETRYLLKLSCVILLESRFSGILQQFKLPQISKTLLPFCPLVLCDAVNLL